MTDNLKNDAAALDALLQQTKEAGFDFLHRLATVPTSVRPPVLAETEWPAAGIGGAAALELFRARFEPIMVASGGPRYWGFVTGGTTPAALMGDWLTGVYDQNPQDPRGLADVSAAVELQTVDLLRQLFGLPAGFFGGFVTGATMSNFTGLAVARQWLGAQAGHDVAKDGVLPGGRVLTATPHSSSVKALAMLGMGSRHFTAVKTMPGNREAIDLADLEAHLEGLNGQPCILISSAGTVNTVDFDDFTGIARLRARYTFWWHIDAAFGGFAACSPDYAHLVQGWEEADSIAIDCHKWLNVPYDSAFFLIKDAHRRLQIETFQNANAPYLGDPADNFNYLNFLPENSRRLRALPVWFALMAYGQAGFRAIVENSVAMAQQLGDFVAQHPRFELLAPVRLNTVCFTLSGAAGQDESTHFLKKLNDSGRVFMTPTTYRGVKGIRAAFVNWRTTAADVEVAMAEMTSALSHTFI